jgi:uncharacterized membrane protein
MEKKDQDNYRLGLFYFNRDDKSIFVKRKYGFGFSPNWANPLAWIIVAGIVVFIILVS